MNEAERQYFDQLPEAERQELERRSRLWRTHVRFEFFLKSFIVLFLIFPLLWFAAWTIDLAGITFWYCWLATFIAVLLFWFLGVRSYRIYFSEVEEGNGTGWMKFSYAGRTVILNNSEKPRWQRSHIYAPLNPQQSLEFKELIPSIDGAYRAVDHVISYYPCCLTLSNGEQIDRCYIVPKRSLKESHSLRALTHPDLLIPIKGVAHICESNQRLPAHIANEIYFMGDSGGGGRGFCLEFSNGRRQSYGADLGPIDFLRYPKGLGPADVIGLCSRRGSWKELTVAAHRICIFDDEPEGEM